MKTSLSFFIINALFCSVFNHVQAQSSAAADVSATISTPIAIEKISGNDLNFGNIASGKSAGLVILNTNGVRVSEGGATLPASTGAVSVAEFLVTGEPLYSFSITLPSNPITIVNSVNPAETMIVDRFISSPEATGTLPGGKQVLKIGARLQINPGQAPGVYISALPFNVTVNYN
ncbi:DUF4402 domain-containing protein [Paradesertivirga mongoliensis]|uniref:DUF4402 domain-containing protein n=1 Tax=Paradesertivirga mongoliensis TaxID=2100740 RepID=A0ABW4ZMW1_9SPHI|nr:DUF4402 domain-containing protein [Pedobacter mongoliensis]